MSQRQHQHEHPQQRQRSERASGCVGNLAALGAAMAVYLIVFPIGLLIHINAPQLEAPGVVVTSVPGVVVAVVCIRVRRLRWLSGGLAALLLGLGMALAIVHGWTAQVEAAYALACLLFIVVFGVYFRWLHRRMVRSIYPAEQQQTASHPRAGAPVSWAAVQAQLATDPHAVVVYPSKWKVGGMLAFQCAIILGCGVGIALIVHSATSGANISLVAGLAFFALIGVLGAPSSIRRFLDSDPAVCIYREGIFDNCSLRSSGLGLIPWKEVTGSHVVKYGQGAGSFSRRYVVIFVAHPTALIARQSGWKRWLLRLTFRWMLSPIRLPEAILPLKATALEAQMRGYYESHVAKQEHDE